MGIGNEIYDRVLYNYRIKQIATRALKNPYFVGNPLYKKFYQRILLQKMQKFEKRPFRVMIENTNACNAGCVFCPHKSMKRSVGTMGLPLTKEIVDDCVRSSISYLTVYGFGEPLLDKQFFERIRYAKSKGIPRVTTNTNAAFLNEKKARQLLESGIDEIYISFDAATPETYRKIRPNLDFETVENNILRLIEMKKDLYGGFTEEKIKKPEIILSFVKNNQNQHEVQEYIDKWKGKVDHTSISTIHNWTGSVASQQEKMCHLRRDPCRLLWTDMVISWNGDVPLCCNDFENTIILGNIKDQSIGEIWGGEKLQRIREYHQKGEFHRIPACAKCEYNYHHKSNWLVSK
jgi:radical SAM protein with 4Fe4S-binding SPASM domain